MKRHGKKNALVLFLCAFGAAWFQYGGASQGGNRLRDEISPYLLLHAHNPVDWYPWGDEALACSRGEDKPIFLSVGYSTCYWCHVMERKVFSDPEIAALMNDYFIDIKVDREERPDLDDIYMTATQLMTGSGGWPNSVFLTPDLKPFYAGTYFPPEDMPGRRRFPGVIYGMSRTWENDRSRVETYANRVTDAIRAIKSEAFVADDSVVVDRSLVDGALTQLKSRYDAQNGGFGGAPKFPQAAQLELLLAEFERTGDQASLRLVRHALDAMAGGGIYDHLGGGFHRYATDSRWRTPHFEKMLYNQADLSRVYLKAYRITEDPEYLRVAADILEFVARDMIGPEGAFYSATDSETDAVEGLHYLWADSEIREALGGDAALFFWVYGLAPVAENDGEVLYRISPLAKAAAEIGMDTVDLGQRIDAPEHRLLGMRNERERPLVDTKVLTAWNGLMISAFAEALEVTGEQRYHNIAVKAAEFILKEMRDSGGRLMRTYRDGEVKYRAYQQDYAYLGLALSRLHSVTGDSRWLRDRVYWRIIWWTRSGMSSVGDSTSRPGKIPCWSAQSIHLTRLWHRAMPQQPIS